MGLSFQDYCSDKGFFLGEMAQSKDDEKATIQLDDEDKDFVQQAVENAKRLGYNISPAAALRARYTLMLADKDIDESGNVRFFGRARTPYYIVPIERTHKNHLKSKLKSMGMANAAEHGLTPLEDLDPTNKSKYYEKAFGVQNSIDAWNNGKIEVNYGRTVGRKVTIPTKPKEKMAKLQTARTAMPQEPAMAATHTPTSIPEEPTAAEMPHEQEPEGESYTANEVPWDWALKFRWSDHGQPDKDKDWAQLEKTGNYYDFSDLWEGISTIVGPPDKATGKYIHPEVWRMFKEKLPKIGHAIYNGIRRTLMQEDPSALENPIELKQAVMQVAAMILSNPLPSGMKNFSQTGDYFADVERLFSSNSQIEKMARSHANKVIARKWKDISQGAGFMKAGGGSMGAGQAFIGSAGHAEPDKDYAINTLALEKLTAQIQPILAKFDSGQIGDLSQEDWDLIKKHSQLEKKVEADKERLGMTVGDSERLGIATHKEVKPGKLVPVSSLRKLKGGREIHRPQQGGEMSRPLVGTEESHQVTLSFSEWVERRKNK